MSDVAPDSTGKGTVKFAIKNPSRPVQDYVVEVPIEYTLAQVQQVIHQKYEGAPLPEEQMLIYEGKVLKNFEAKVQDLISGPIDFSHPYSLHLVIRRLGTAASAPQPAPPAAGGEPGTSQTASKTAPPPAAHNPPGQSDGNNQDSSAATQEASSSTQQAAPATLPTAVDSQTSSMPQVPSPLYPFMTVNPIMAAAYQAAYAAALTTAATLAAPSTPPQSGVPTTSSIPMLPHSIAPPIIMMSPIQPLALYCPVALAPPGVVPTSTATTLSSPMLSHPFFPGGYLMGGNMQSHQGATAGPSTSRAMPPQQTPQQGAPAAPPLAPFPAPGPAQGPVGDGVPGVGPPGGPPRQRVITFRISARTLLQLLVFILVMYQHNSWNRIMLLLGAALVLYLAVSWGPMRTILTRITAPRAPAADERGAQGETDAPAAVRRGFRLTGILWEVLQFVVGFVTTLLPIWNYNPEDAAVFAAAQGLGNGAQGGEGERRGQGEGNDQRPQEEEHPHQE